MIIDNNYELCSWKCGKGKAFTHIPTILFIIYKTTSYKYNYNKGANKHYKKIQH